MDREEKVNDVVQKKPKKEKKKPKTQDKRRWNKNKCCLMVF